MRTKKIVGIALIMFCIFLLFVYSFGFLANKSWINNNLIAKKDDIVNNSVVIIDNRTSNNVVKENTTQNTTTSTPVMTSTTKPRTVQRVTRAS